MITKQDFYTFNGYSSEEDFVEKTSCYVEDVLSYNRVILKHVDPFISAHKRMAITQYDDKARVVALIANLTMNSKAILEHKYRAYNIIKTAVSIRFNIPEEYIKDEDIVFSSNCKVIEFLGHKFEYNSNVSKKEVSLSGGPSSYFWTTWQHVFEVVDKITKFKLERSDSKY